MKIKLRLLVHLGGKVEGIYDDTIASIFSGRIRTQRLSSVEFNSRKQRWEARLPGGALLTHSPMRCRCLQQEKELMEQKMVNQYL